VILSRTTRRLGWGVMVLLLSLQHWPDPGIASTLAAPKQPARKQERTNAPRYMVRREWYHPASSEQPIGGEIIYFVQILQAKGIAEERVTQPDLNLAEYLKKRPCTKSDPCEQVHFEEEHCPKNGLRATMRLVDERVESGMNLPPHFVVSEDGNCESERKDLMKDEAYELANYDSKNQ